MPLSTGWILAGVAAVGGVAYVVIRRQQAAAEQRQREGGERCRQVKAAAELARQSGDPRAIAAAEAAIAACEAGSMLDDLLNNPFETTAAHNSRLNGPAKKAAHPSLHAQTQWIAYGAGDSEIGLGVLEYENGCVPFPEAPGWERCADGTRPQCKPDELGVADVYSTACNRIGQGGGGSDPITRRHRTREEMDVEYQAFQRNPAAYRGSGAAPNAPLWKPFPLDCPAGAEKWWVKGEPKCLPACAPGSARTEGREADHREGADGVPHCWSTDVTVPPPSSGPRPPSGGVSPFERVRRSFPTFREDPAR